MKLLITIITIMLVFSLNAIDQTFTMSDTLITNLRATSDPLISEYLDNTRLDDEPVRGDRITDLANEYKKDAKKAFYAFFDGSPGAYSTNTSDLDDIVQLLKEDYLIGTGDPDTTPIGSLTALLYNSSADYRYYEDIDGTSTDFNYDDENGVYCTMANYDRTGLALYSLGFISFMYDMVYYYIDVLPDSESVRETIEDRIDTFSTYLYHYLSNPSFLNNSLQWNTAYTPLWVGSYNNNAPLMTIGGGRPLKLISALAYSRLVLGKEYSGTNADSAFSYCMEMLLETEMPPGSDIQGLLDLLTYDGGMYAGGDSYSSQTLTGPPLLFFAALKRTFGVNLWDNQHVVNWMKAIANYRDPDFNTIPSEDSWVYPETRFGIEKGLIPFFYQNTSNEEIRKTARWIILRKKNSS